ncbi:MAG: ABC transporter permease [Cyclobacteriaceae bacterium]
MKQSPPKYALLFLRWFCRRDLCYHIEGDLLEFFQLNAEKKGTFNAKYFYWIDVLKLLRPEMIRFFHQDRKLKLTNMTMHYFKLAIRRLLRNGKTSIASIIGISVGLVAVFLMLFYIQYETSYDTFHEHSDNMYMVERTLQNSRIKDIYDRTPYPLADELVRSIPEIEMAASTSRTSNYFGYDDQQIYEENGLFADQDFLDIYSFDFIAGSKEEALNDPYGLIISESLSEKIDPYGTVIGKTIRLNKKHDFKITGIFKDHPENSHLNIDYLLSFDAFRIIRQYDPNDDWKTDVSVTYVVLNALADAGTTNLKISDILDDHNPVDQGYTELLSLRPVKDVYLYSSKVRGGNGRRSEITIIYLFLGVVIFTIIVTALNYINSTVAQTLTREKEMGIKKVMGSSGNDLALQFFAEAATLLIISLLVAITIAVVILPVFGEVVDRNLHFVIQRDWRFLLTLILATLFVGCLAGIYPVLYLTRLKISSFLNGITSLNRRTGLRKVLVVFQLVISIPLIFTAILVSEQISYLKDKDIGFNRNGLLRASINTDQVMEGKIEAIRQQLLQIPEVISCSFSSTAPFYSANGMDVTPDGVANTEKYRLRTHQVDYEFLETYQMQLVEGRALSEEYATDQSQAVIINETTKNLFGWKEAVGKKLNNGKLTVIGVVKDFNDYTLFKKIRPMAIMIREQNPKGIYVSVRVNTDEQYEIAKQINSLVNDEFPEEPVQFQYLAQHFDNGYLRSLENVSDMFVFFSLLAIALCAIGLYNLVSYSARLQRKMIAIRKVLGAGLGNLSLLMLKQYLTMFVIAAVIGLTSSFLLSKLIFGILPYHTTIKISYLIASGAIVLAVVLFSVLSKIFSTVRANPVDSISSE